MASLISRNGTYYAQFYDASRTPSAKRHSLRTSSKSEARKRLVELERDWEAGVFDPWYDDPWAYKQRLGPTQPLSLQAALDVFLEAKMRQGRSEATMRHARPRGRSTEDA